VLSLEPNVHNFPRLGDLVNSLETIFSVSKESTMIYQRLKTKNPMHETLHISNNSEEQVDGTGNLVSKVSGSCSVCPLDMSPCRHGIDGLAFT